MRIQAQPYGLDGAAAVNTIVAYPSTLNRELRRVSRERGERYAFAIVRELTPAARVIGCAIQVRRDSWSSRLVAL